MYYFVTQSENSLKNIYKLIHIKFFIYYQFIINICNLI